MQIPHESHWKTTKRILRYVRGTIQFKIHYSSGGTPLLVGFTDSDWADDPDDRKSTAGYVFSLGSGLDTWACKKKACYCTFFSISRVLSSDKCKSGSLVASTDPFRVWI
jgi:hypothetical protein